MTFSSPLYQQSSPIVAQWEDSLTRANASVSDITSEPFRNPFCDKHSFLLSATFGISDDSFDTVDVIWCQLEHFTYPHPASCLKLQNESISYFRGGIDDFIYTFSAYHCPDAYSRWTKNPFDDGTVTGVGKLELIAVEDVVEESSKVSAPAVPGALFSDLGQGSKKAKHIFRGNTVNFPPSKFSRELTEHKVIAFNRVFFPSLPGDIPGKP